MSAETGRILIPTKVVMEAVSSQTVSTDTVNTETVSTASPNGDTLNIASTGADAEAAEAIEQQHAEMAGALELKSESLVAAARSGNSDAFHAAQDALVRWSRRELLPQLRATEETIHRAAAAKTEARLLVQALVAEHSEITYLVSELEGANDVVAALGAAAALRRVVTIHLAKENEQVLPLLVADPQTDVSALLDGIRELVTSAETQEAAAPQGHGGHGKCGCGEIDEEGYPELDVQTIPHAIRHATLFGALDALAPTSGVIFRATHDPVPLLAQLSQRSPGAFQVDYLERGPEFWRLQIVRQTT